MTSSVTSPSTSFLTNASTFTGVVAGVPDWSARSACADWTAAEVVDHIVDTQRDLFAQHGADLGPRPAGGPSAIWAAHLTAVTPYVEDEAWMAKEYDGWFGPTTVGDTVAKFYGFDLIVHGWDIGTAERPGPEWTRSQLDQVEASIASFGPALYTEGICKPAVDAPADASRQTRLLAQLGRPS
jgi:Mycothiol maleylpyruvate isomerase N-terminal domain